MNKIKGEKIVFLTQWQGHFMPRNHKSPKKTKQNETQTSDISQGFITTLGSILNINQLKKSYTKTLQIDALRLTWLETILGWKCYIRPECYTGITALSKAELFNEVILNINMWPWQLSKPSVAVKKESDQTHCSLKFNKTETRISPHRGYARKPFNSSRHHT